MTIAAIILAALTATLPVVGIIGLVLYARWLWQNRETDPGF